MTGIVLASNNRGKLAEFDRLLASHGLTLYPLSQFVAQGAEEVGTTFRENALLKARYAAMAAGMPALADDSGLEVDALAGAPGVYSARYAGANATDADNNCKLLAALQTVPPAARTARYRCVLVYVRTADDPNPIVAEGVWEGAILQVPRGANGFGYDPLFLPRDEQLSAAELPADTKNALSHRGQAMRSMFEQLPRAGVSAA